MYVGSGESQNDTGYIYIWGLIWKFKVTAWIGPNDAWWIKLKVSGAYLLIFWCMPYVHVSSKVAMLLCLNGYQQYTWWCVESAIVLQSKYIKLFRDVATGPNLSLTCLSCSLNFGGIQWSWCWNCFWLYLLLMLTLCPCRFPFHTQDIILARSYYRLSNLAVTSVDGCCLYIIIHNSISHRTWL